MTSELDDGGMSKGQSDRMLSDMEVSLKQRYGGIEFLHEEKIEAIGIH